MGDYDALPLAGLIDLYHEAEREGEASREAVRAAYAAVIATKGNHAQNEAFAAARAAQEASGPRLDEDAIRDAIRDRVERLPARCCTHRGRTYIFGEGEDEDYVEIREGMPRDASAIDAESCPSVRRLRPGRPCPPGPWSGGRSPDSAPR
jgi:hypothetical protein